MPSINDTAYPRLKSHPTQKELDEVYTPSSTELVFVNSQTRQILPNLGMLILLKTFQRLGYFTSIGDVPAAIINHIVRSIGLAKMPSKPETYDQTSARKRHMKAIRAFLNVTVVGKESEEAMNLASRNAAKTKDDLADIINVTIEELVRQRYELPAFSSLAKSAQTARYRVNQSIYRTIHESLGEKGLARINALFTGGPKKYQRDWNKVKMEPKRPTVGNMLDFVTHLNWLRHFGLGSESFAGIPDVKLTRVAKINVW